MIKYKAKSYNGTIEKIECVRETDHFVIVISDWFGKKHERKEKKITDYDCIFDTWELAHAHLMAKAESELTQARLALQKAQGFYGNVKGMKNPDGEEMKDE